MTFSLRVHSILPFVLTTKKTVARNLALTREKLKASMESHSWARLSHNEQQKLENVCSTGSIKIKTIQPQSCKSFRSFKKTSRQRYSDFGTLQVQRQPLFWSHRLVLERHFFTVSSDICNTVENVSWTIGKSFKRMSLVLCVPKAEYKTCPWERR